MALVNAFSINNLRLAAAPPGYFVPDVNGVAIPIGHSSWRLMFDTTGLPTNQPLVHVIVQYHYTNVQLGASGLPNQGQVTNLDNSVTQIIGGTFTGWINDCEEQMNTTVTNQLGQIIFKAYLGCDLQRVIGAYPDFGRFLVLTSPGYASVPSVSLQLN